MNFITLKLRAKSEIEFPSTKRRVICIVIAVLYLQEMLVASFTRTFRHRGIRPINLFMGLEYVDLTKSAV